MIGGGEEDGENYISGNIPGTYQQKDLLVLEAISSSDYENGNADGKKSFRENDHYSLYRHLDLVF